MTKASANLKLKLDDIKQLIDHFYCICLAYLSQVNLSLEGTPSLSKGAVETWQQLSLVLIATDINMI